MIRHKFQARQSAEGSRRRFLQTVGGGALSVLISESARGQLQSLPGPVRLGLITDLHHDIMHDGADRLDVFLSAMETEAPDAIVQLGDFAVPSPANQPLIDTFNRAHPQALHVLGNHDIDGGYSWQQTLDAWNMPERYYSRDINGLRLVVLDGNEPPVGHVGGYPSYIGPEQLEWLQDVLQKSAGPVLVISHQPLAGPWAIDNAEAVRGVLNDAADRVLLAVNGHSHIDHLVRADQIGFLHLNSASYVWVGGDYRHDSYSAEIHATRPRLTSTCPYKDPLFTTLTVDPVRGRIDLQGCNSQWVGPSPGELGRDKHPDLMDGEQIAPRIRSRQLQLVATR